MLVRGLGSLLYRRVTLALAIAGAASVASLFLFFSSQHKPATVAIDVSQLLAGQEIEPNVETAELEQPAP
ncbi:MAG TPA: hypothetical protein VEF03_13130, partial [Candidatus Binataceae bacterium]|nr:hypothetical protein [Candidatus Binataceae bacterium]